MRLWSDSDARQPRTQLPNELPIGGIDGDDGECSREEGRDERKDERDRFLRARGGHDANAKGDKYYYADGKFIGAISSDGKEMDMKNADTKKMADKLKKESAAFRAAAK